MKLIVSQGPLKHLLAAFALAMCASLFVMTGGSVPVHADCTPGSPTYAGPGVCGHPQQYCTPGAVGYNAALCQQNPAYNAQYCIQGGVNYNQTLCQQSLSGSGQYTAYCTQGTTTYNPQLCQQYGGTASLNNAIY